MLEAFRRFLEEYGEGALVVLTLLETINHPEQWLALATFSDDIYLLYNTLFLPDVIGREPLEILQILEALQESFYQRDYARECAKYYWHAEPVAVSRVFDESFEYLRSRAWGTSTYDCASVTGVLAGSLTASKAHVY